jgi:hypothetical protein
MHTAPPRKPTCERERQRPLFAKSYPDDLRYATISSPSSSPQPCAARAPLPHSLGPSDPGTLRPQLHKTAFSPLRGGRSPPRPRPHSLERGSVSLRVGVIGANPRNSRQVVNSDWLPVAVGYTLYPSVLGSGSGGDRQKWRHRELQMRAYPYIHPYQSASTDKVGSKQSVNLWLVGGGLVQDNTMRLGGRSNPLWNDETQIPHTGEG